MRTDGINDAPPVAKAERPDWRWRRDAAKEVLLVLMQRKSASGGASLDSYGKCERYEFELRPGDAAVAAVAIVDDLLEALRKERSE